MEYQKILDFWFAEGMESQWFAKSAAFDAEVKQRFHALYQAAKAGELASWESSPRSRLALIILYDQFTRNMFRDTAAMFEADAIALQLARDGIHQGMAQDFSRVEKQFFYMPLMHSEDVSVQEEAVALYEAELDEQTGAFARAHRDIIVKFGRFPHRNALLGRESTAEEIVFLTQPGSSF